MLDQAALLNMILNGGPHAIAAMMAVIILILMYERKRLLGEVSHKDSLIEKNTDNYHTDVTKLAEAINQLRLLLAEMKGRLQ